MLFRVLREPQLNCVNGSKIKRVYSDHRQQRALSHQWVYICSGGVGSVEENLGKAHTKLEERDLHCVSREYLPSSSFLIISRVLPMPKSQKS